ncbi:MAG TPA: type IV secretion system protein [Vicinamibacterales bacterium]|nr:type IV secretion system protein [Vicinamibacterales bacterium]HWI19196.1 type IV secretion system protein [Vicinamibacterales bacterium]
MEPQPNLAIVATIQQAISTLLTTYEPEFLRFGHSLFMAFATILIVWQGIRMMLTHDTLGDDMFRFAKLLLFVSFGYALIAFYESPIPGIGVSFSNLITDQAHMFQNILEARSLELVYEHLDTLWGQFVQPDAWSILANLLYWLLLIVVTLAKVISLAIVAFGMIASAICALVGPIFVPFFIVPKLDWLFWSWFKAFVQYSFIPVIAFAFLMIFERFIFRYLTTLPPGITEDYYLVYGLQAIVVIGVFAVGILLVPSLTSSIFSGRGGESVIQEQVRLFR